MSTVVLNIISNADFNRLSKQLFSTDNVNKSSQPLFSTDKLNIYSQLIVARADLNKNNLSGSLQQIIPAAELISAAELMR